MVGFAAISAMSATAKLEKGQKCFPLTLTARSAWTSVHRTGGTDQNGAVGMRAWLARWLARYGRMRAW